MRAFRLAKIIGLGSLLFAVRARADGGPTLTVTNITMPAGETFQMPLRGSDPENSPLTFSLVSISNTNVTGVLTNSNRSLKLHVTGKDASTNDFNGDLILELFEDITSNTTARIISLVQSNFYNNLTFHRIIDNFVAQGGDPNGDGSGGTGVTFKDEFDQRLTFNGFGQLAMANSGRDSNDCQFFITDEDLTLDTSGGVTNPPPRFLNFRYTLFGQMTEGFDVLNTMMHTPIGDPNTDRPAFPVTITAATVFTNQMDAVLRLTAARSFTGTVTVTVSAMNTNSLSAQQSFVVNVISNTVNNPPFLASLPDITTIQNLPVQLPIKAADLEGDQLTFIALDPNTLDFLANVQADFNPKTSTYTFTPALGFSGVVPILIGVRDQTDHNGDGVVNEIQEFDTELINLTVQPLNPTPTLAIIITKGQVLNTLTPGFDMVKATGTIHFNDQSPDHSFNPFTEGFDIRLGGPADQAILTLLPGDPGWKGKDGKFSWSPPKGTRAKIKLQIDTVTGKFTFAVNMFDFQAQQLNPIRLQLTMGNDWGFEESNWRVKTPGWLFFPP